MTGPVDIEARTAIVKISHLIEQQVQLSNNFLLLSALRGELARIRESLGAPGQLPTPSFHANPMAPPPVQETAPLSQLPMYAPPPLPMSSAQVHPPAVLASMGGAPLPIMSPQAGIEIVGCKGCNRTADELVAQGHAEGCASVRNAQVVQAG